MVLGTAGYCCKSCLNVQFNKNFIFYVYILTYIADKNILHASFQHKIALPSAKIKRKVMKTTLLVIENVNYDHPIDI